MKRLLTVLLMAAGWQAASQNVKPGFKAAVQMNTFTGYETIYDKFSGTKAGWLAGPTVEFSLYETFAIQSGILFSTQGGDLGPYVINIYALQLPAVAVYRRQRFFIGAGPVLSYGLHGRFAGGGDWNESRDLYEDGSALPMNRLDVLAQATMGFDLSKKIQLGSFYNKSLLNTSNSTDKPGFKTKLDSYGISLNYIF